LRVTGYLLAFCVAVAVASFGFTQESSAPPPFPGYEVTPHVVYGQGLVTRGDKNVSRDLWMDVYEPLEKTHEARPAVIMTFGGAFHRGSPRQSFREGGAQDTSMGDYCRKLAELGYVCFAIDYRLAPENPVLSMSGYSQEDINPESFKYILPQINLVRNAMGFEAIDPQDLQGAKFLRDIVLSPAEDLRKAVHHIRKSAEHFGIDPDRIVLGGFSAGAITSWNVAHGMNAPVAGVFLLSGVGVGLDFAKSVTADSPPILMFLGEDDLEGGLQLMPIIIQDYEQVGTEHAFVWVPGFGHFYPSGAKSLGADASRMSVEARIEDFLEKTVGKR